MSVTSFHPAGCLCGICQQAVDQIAARYQLSPRVKPSRFRKLRYPITLLLVAVVCFAAGVMFERHVLIPPGFQCVSQDGHRACWTVIH